ncbi:MAG: four helix bundle protein [Candidatus Zambryskibacteria bacterium]
MQYKRFEEIKVWNESKNFVNDIYNLIFTHQKLQKDYSLVDQLKRASYSIMLNIAEGFERGSNKEFDELYSKIENISAQLSNFRKFLISSIKKL